MFKILNNPWIVTIVGTTIGVFIAFFLNNYREDYKEQKKIKLFIKQIKQEIINNKKAVEENYNSLQKIKVYKDFFDFYNVEDSVFAMTIEQKKDFIYKYGDSNIVFHDSAIYKDDLYEYDVSFISNNIDLLFKPNEVVDFSWNLFKSVDVFQSLEFELLKELDNIYKSQSIIVERISELMMYNNKNIVIESISDLISLIENLYIIRELNYDLLKSYDKTIESLPSYKNNLY